MASLASAVDAAVAKLGFEREDRPFKSHITIGRVKVSRNLDALARGIQEAEAVDLGAQQVNSVAVMQSELRPDGPVYTPLETVELGAA